MFKASVSFLIILATASGLPASAAQWPPEAGAKVPGNAMQFPTKLEAVNRSLAALLNDGASVVTSYVGNTGPVVTVKKGHKYTVCILEAADPATDQNVATSRCYNIN